jgi:hypothetical protein
MNRPGNFLEIFDFVLGNHDKYGGTFALYKSISKKTQSVPPSGFNSVSLYRHL